MKYNKTLLFLLGIVGCISSVIAQPTWQVGNTTLTEYDLVTGINLPWEILWGPDDYIWATERDGEVLRIDPETGNYTEVLSITVTGNGNSEPGMLGMAMHPDWDTSPKVYIAYCSGSTFSGEERLSVFDWDGTALINEEILIDDIGLASIHNGSRLIITPDNKILMSTGDNGSPANSQNMNSLNGKILRINLDGTIPADNPDPSSYVWSFGHRNSQGLCVGYNGIIYSSEHGQSNSDEFNIIEPDRNYGWPTVEGACNTTSEINYCNDNDVREPLKEWSPCIAVNGIEYYDHEAIPEWQHSVLMSVMAGFAAPSQKRLAVLHLSADGMEVESEDQYFSSFNQRIRDICVNPYTGAVYVAFNGGSYPGSGPNNIKEFVNEAYNAIGEPESSTSQSIEVYPNPVGDSSVIRFSNDFLGTSYEIYDFNGKLVKQSMVAENEMKLTPSDFTSGQYFIKSTTIHGTVTRTFIVK